MLSEAMSVMQARDLLQGATALFLAALACLVGSCGAERTRPRAVVIGIDGADWAVIDPLAAEGRLPHLSALRARRDQAAVDRALDAIEAAARGDANLIPRILDAVECYATTGEISDRLREVFGVYRESFAL